MWPTLTNLLRSIADPKNLGLKLGSGGGCWFKKCKTRDLLS